MGEFDEQAGESKPNSDRPGWAVRGGASAVLLLAVGQAAAVLSLLLITRQVPSDTFGRLSSGLAFQNYVILLGSLGLRTLVVRDLARSPQQVSRVWGTYWALVAPFGIAVTVSGHFVAGLFFDREPLEVTMSRWLALGAWFSMLSVVPLLDGLNRQRRALGIVALTEGLFLAGLITHLIPRDLAGLGAAFAIKWILASLLQAIILLRSTRIGRLNVSRGLADSWRVSIPPLLSTSLIVNLPLTAAVLLARQLFGGSEAGVVGLGTQFAAGVTLAGGVAVRFLQPMWPDRAAMKRRQASGQFRQLAIVGMVGWLIGCVVAGIVVRGFLRPEYSADLVAILLLLTAGSLEVVARILWIALLALNDERGVLFAYVCGCSSFLLAVTLLWAYRDINTIALATVIGSATTVMIARRRAAVGLSTESSMRSR